ncbi:MAG: flagellar basal body-associated FliL family protein [Planctomycetota bacterium]
MPRRCLDDTPPGFCPPAAAAAACVAVCGLLFVSGVTGCGSGEALHDYERFEQLQLRESLVETPLGRYSIPVPVIRLDEAGEMVRTNLIQIKFALHGLVKPGQEDDTARLFERNEGQLRDRVIRVCRNSSLEDLLDPQLSTLRSRILDAAQPLFESVVLKRVLVTDVFTEPL